MILLPAGMIHHKEREYVSLRSEWRDNKYRLVVFSWKLRERLKLVPGSHVAMYLDASRTKRHLKFKLKPTPHECALAHIFRKDSAGRSLGFFTTQLPGEDFEAARYEAVVTPGWVTIDLKRPIGDMHKKGPKVKGKRKADMP